MSTPTQIITALNNPMSLDPGLGIYLELAEATTSRGFFHSAVDNGDWAVALKAMHIWTLAQRTLGESGAVGSKSEGELSISFIQSVRQVVNDDLDQTHWGKQLKNLIRQQGPLAAPLRAPAQAGDYISPESLSDIAMQILSQE